MRIRFWKGNSKEGMAVNPETGQIGEFVSSGFPTSLTNKLPGETVTKPPTTPTTYTTYKQCHKYGPVEVFTTKGYKGRDIVVHAGAAREVDLSSVDAIVDMAGTAEPMKQNPGRGFNRARTLLSQAIRRVQYIHVPTEDMSVPRAGKEFWTALAEDIKTDEPGHVLVCCLGGHGRTGVGLSILAVLLGAVPENTDPIEWIREHYCEEAVESTKQIKYIGRITGRRIHAAPAAKTYTSSGWDTGAGYDAGKYYPGNQVTEDGWVYDVKLGTYVPKGQESKKWQDVQGWKDDEDEGDDEGDEEEGTVSIPGAGEAKT